MDELQKSYKTALYLLDSITVIRNKYDEIAKATGENFNIFSVLHLESDEVRLHSRLLGELLNPNGSHNQNELFLKLFVSVIGLEKQYTNEQLKSAKVIVEEYIGSISDDYSKGGRIDLVIKFPNNNVIVIENKIWAGDQFNQLGRYFEQYKQSNIIYLTLFGDKPSLTSLGKLPLDKVNCISYQTEIITWLELCQKEAYKLPLIREILSHYINLINKLTNKTNYHQMNDDISNLITKDISYFKSANDLVNSFNLLNKTIITNSLTKLKYKFFEKYGEHFKKDYNKPFDNNIIFFTYKDYNFRLRLADEFGISIWLAPEKKTGQFGVANQADIKPFKEYFESLKNDYNVYSNGNYTAWIISKNNFLHWDIEKKYKLTNPDFVDDIVNEIINEIEAFVTSFKKKVIENELETEVVFQSTI